MVLPVTGPIVTNVGTAGAQYARSQHKYRQRRPYNLVLPYGLSQAYLESKTGDESADAFVALQALNGAEQAIERARVLAYNQAYARAISQMSDSAQLGTAFAELGSSVQMVVKRSMQIVGTLRELRRGNVVGAAKILWETDKPIKTKRYVSPTKRRAENVASQFLEWHFGWEPLIKDIHNAIKVLEEPVKATKIIGRATDNFQWTNGPVANFSRQTSITGALDAVVGFEFVVDNPNLYLANKMGLTNPATIAWELVPFSFVVDWFGNVGQVLSGMTDFLGTSRRNPYTTYVVKAGVNFDWKGYPWSSSWRTFQVNRYLGIANPSFAWKRFSGFSPIRGATALALLLQLMPGEKEMPQFMSISKKRPGIKPL